ncbi:MAG: 3',5'-cyclic-nucleotide phosphodiesterase [Deltaproteobacteria bacterium]|uniref:3',5'-cyclic-nucleotide phosphodiesterase n=1 Tax=Candidatus Zymogenus saltonus TaxID=2844893 RepID=A0A9D8KDD8_9DELT|nr:3',5'-cyclic-nucleotide phosphodiesterase [Candidatus Zymogenus saltonus]
MKIQVLGCNGGIIPGTRPPSFLINEEILIDAGHVTGQLTVDQQDKVRQVFITHFHLDHTKDLAFLSDNAYERQGLPITVYGSKATISDFKEHFFNDHTWPDFTKIKSGKDPVVNLQELIPNVDRKAGKTSEVAVRPFPVNHSIDAFGYLVIEGGSSVIFSGDTGPVDKLWEIANNEALNFNRLKAIFIETSFPSSLQRVADVSFHLTPYTLKKELEKFKTGGIPVYLYHLKPRYYKIIKGEIEAMNNDDISILENDQVFIF